MNVGRNIEEADRESQLRLTDERRKKEKLDNVVKWSYEAFKGDGSRHNIIDKLYTKAYG